MCRILIASVVLAGLAQPASAGKLRLQIVDEDGETLPARVLVRPTGADCLVPGDAVRLEIGPDRWFMTAGVVELDVPPGDLLVRVEHGLEFNRFRKTLTVPRGGLRETVTLTRWIDLRKRGYLCSDNHLHVDTRTLTPMLVCEGLDFGSSMTWWNGPDQRRPIPPGTGHVRLLTFAGRSTPTSVYDAELEFGWGAAYIQGMSEPLPLKSNRRRPNLEYLQRAKSAGGIVHYQAGWSREVLFDALSGVVDTVNICNNNFHMHRYQQRSHYSNLLNVEGLPVYPNTEAGMLAMNTDTYYRLLNCGLKLAAGAGSATGAKQVPIGYNRAYVCCDPDATLDEFHTAWAAGRNFVTNGPVLFLTTKDGAMPGDTIRLPAGGGTVEVNVDMLCGEPTLKFERLDILVNGQIADVRTPAPADDGLPGGVTVTLGRTLPIEIRHSSWIAVRCLATDTLLSDDELAVYSHGDDDDRYRIRPSRIRFAHTSPIYVDVEGSQRGELPAMQEADRMLEQFSAYAEQYCDESLRQAILSQIDQARANLARRHSKNDLERDKRLK